jgi:hypothetical protein
MCSQRNSVHLDSTPTTPLSPSRRTFPFELGYAQSGYSCQDQRTRPLPKRREIVDGQRGRRVGRAKLCFKLVAVTLVELGFNILQSYTVQQIFGRVSHIPSWTHSHPGSGTSQCHAKRVYCPRPDRFRR